MASWAAIILAVLQVVGGMVTGAHKVHKHRKHNRKKVEQVKESNGKKMQNVQTSNAGK